MRVKLKLKIVLSEPMTAGTLCGLFKCLGSGSGGQGNVWDVVTDEGNVMTEVFLPVGTNPELGILCEPLGEGQSITEAGEDWQDHLPPGVSENLRNVASLSQAEAVLVRAPPEDR